MTQKDLQKKAWEIINDFDACCLDSDVAQADLTQLINQHTEEIKQAVLGAIPEKVVLRDGTALGYNQAINEITKNIEMVFEEKG